MQVKVYTLVFLKKNNSILLGFKTRGRGTGLWNGFGGKVKKNESVIECAQRELQEECNLIAKDLKHIGVVRFELLHIDLANVVHILICQEFEGVEKASEEMNPIRWYEVGSIPFEQMLPDSKQWYPFMLAEKYFSAKFIYEDNENIVHHVIKEHESLKKALNF